MNETLGSLGHPQFPIVTSLFLIKRLGKTVLRQDLPRCLIAYGRQDEPCRPRSEMRDLDEFVAAGDVIGKVAGATPDASALEIWRQSMQRLRDSGDRRHETIRQCASRRPRHCLLPTSRTDYLR